MWHRSVLLEAARLARSAVEMLAAMTFSISYCDNTSVSVGLMRSILVSVLEVIFVSSARRGSSLFFLTFFVASLLGAEHARLRVDSMP